MFAGLEHSRNLFNSKLKHGPLPVGSHHQIGRIHIRQQVHRQLIERQPSKNEGCKYEDDSGYGAV